MSLTITKTIQQWSVKLVKEKTIAYKQTKISSDIDVKALLGFMSDLPEEHFYAVYLNAKNEPIGINLVSKGTISSALVHPREVFKGALLANASRILVAHNHPSGNTTPSPEDIDVTKQLIAAGKVLGVPVLDHVIMGDDMYMFRSQRPQLWR